MNAAKPLGPGPPNIPNRIAQPWKIKGSAQATRMIRSSRFSSRAPPVNRLNVLMEASAGLMEMVYQKNHRKAKKIRKRGGTLERRPDGRSRGQEPRRSAIESGNGAKNERHGLT